MQDGDVRRALLAVGACTAAAAALAACGGGSATTSVPDKEGDVQILNEILSRQRGAVAAYDRSLRRLGGRDLEAARLFRAQEQEHVDATVKALRGLGGKVEAQPEEIEEAGLKAGADYVEFLYEMEGATIKAELDAVSKLSAPWPRSLLASTVANQAQHLVLLRRELGAKPLETVPEPFESGTEPAP